MTGHLIYPIYQSTNLLLIYNKKALFYCHLIYWSQIYQSPDLLLNYDTEIFLLLSANLLITWSTNHPIFYSNITQKTFFSCQLIYWSQIYQSPNLLLKYNTENFILPSPKLLHSHLIYQSPNLLPKYDTENFILPSPKLLVTWSTNLPISYPNIIQKTLFCHHLNYWSPDLSNLPINQSPTQI